MKDLIEENYQSIVKRGLITPLTTSMDFMEKLDEELDELNQDLENRNFEGVKEELADVILTALNFARHFNIDIEQELRNKIEINNNR